MTSNDTNNVEPVKESLEAVKIKDNSIKISLSELVSAAQELEKLDNKEREDYIVKKGMLLMGLADQFVGTERGAELKKGCICSSKASS